MDKDNFREFIKDSDNKDAELHGWQLMPMPEAESAATIATEIKLIDAFKHR
jgi:hypothetical protein